MLENILGLILYTLIRQKFTVHINLLTQTEVPMFHPQPSVSNTALAMSMYSGPIPWKGVQVIVRKRGDWNRTMTGIVTDVLLNQDTSSSLRVQIMYDRIAGEGVHTGTFDYADIVKTTYVLWLLNGHD